MGATGIGSEHEASMKPFAMLKLVVIPQATGSQILITYVLKESIIFLLL